MKHVRGSWLRTCVLHLCLQSYACMHKLAHYNVTVALSMAWVGWRVKGEVTALQIHI